MNEVVERQSPTAELLPALPSIKATVLAKFKDAEAVVTELANTYRDVAYPVQTPKGLAAAKAARHELRERGRFAVQRAEKLVKDEVNDLKKIMADEVVRLVAIVQPVEDGIDAQIKAREAEIEAAKEAARVAEAERRAKHELGIVTIRSYADRCAGLPSDRIAAGIAQLEATPIVEAAWEDFYAAATQAKSETLATMRRLHDEAKAREEEAARLEAQRIENERIAAEQAAERARLAEAAAKVKADAEALQKRINEQAEKEAAAERERAAEQAKAERAAKLAQIKADIVAKPIPEAPEPQQVLKAEPATADATDRGLPATASPDGGPMGAAQPAAAGRTEDKPLYAPLRAAPAVTFAEPEPAGDVFETMAWLDAIQRKPDSDRTVLCWGTAGFFCGYWDADMGCWIGCESGGTVIGVTHWSEPKGPAGA